VAANASHDSEAAKPRNVTAVISNPNKVLG
jgi:hypothetical protein